MFSSSPKALTIDQIEFLIKHQLLEQKNLEIRPVKDIAKEFPIKCLKSVGITTGFGTAFTAGFSLLTFKKLESAKGDVKLALPVLGMFSAVDFSVNYSITKLTGKKNPTKTISITSGTCAGAACGWYFGEHRVKPTVFGGVCGAIYGAIRNTPLEFLGIEPF